MGTTTTRGNTTEGVILAALMRAGHVVLVPFGLQADYDIVFEEEGQFHKVQCKTGRLKSGSIIFNLSTVKAKKEGGYENRPYGDRVDYFGVYCPETGKCYLVPASEVGNREGSLRVDPPRNGQVKGIRWAKDYEMQV